MGFIRHFLSSTRHPANMTTMIQFVFDKATAASLPQNAVIRIEIPAEAISRHHRRPERIQDPLQHSHIPDISNTVWQVLSL